MKVFNTTAVCNPSKHYMVDISDKVREIRKLVDAGKYFTINRARQYGKTTTISALERELADDYCILSLDFQGISDAGFKTEEAFVKAFSRAVVKKAKTTGMPSDSVERLNDFINRKEYEAVLDELFSVLTDWCENSEKPVVMIIDEVDTATNNQVFLDFLAQLRLQYLEREKNDDYKTFQSVVLAGVTDIKHLKNKIGNGDAEKENSPWNIAADFNLDMSLSEAGIMEMLDEYEADHNTGMNTKEIAGIIREYTSGYPFLVSRICQLIDEQLSKVRFRSLSEAWTGEGVEEAVKSLLTEKNTLFDSLMGKLHDNRSFDSQLKGLLLRGESIEYLPDNKAQEQLMMYGFIVNDNNTVAVANKIFEMRLYKYYVGESRFSEELRGNALDNKPAFIKGNQLDIPLIMERFIETQKQIRDLNNEEAERKFIEEEGREKFLTYLSPIINGTGTYSIEEQTRNRRRMDVVIHYCGKRYIIELKIWHGERYNAKGEEQILDYLDHFSLTTGYMLSFSFNKSKEPGVRKEILGDKVLYEGVV